MTAVQSRPCNAVTGPLQAAGWQYLGALPGTATAPDVARFVPLVLAARPLA